MAIIKIAAPLSGIRGTVGGTTYSANFAGPYARAWTPAKRRNSVFRSAQKNVLAWASETWRTLSSANKALWVAFAANVAQAQTNSLGETYYLTGHQWYVRCNSRLQLMGRSWISAAPTGGYPAQPPVSYLVTTETGAGGSQKLVYPNLTWVGFDFVMECAVTQGVGNQTARAPWFFVCYDTAPGLTQTWTGIGVRDKLGYILAGNMYWARAYRQTAEGLRSPAATINTAAV